MEAKIELPTEIEGSWRLFDAEGNELANSVDQSGAVLKITPYFYRNQHTQVLLRTTVTGKRGRQVEQSLRIGANAGTIKAESKDITLRPIEPGFDKTTPKAARQRKVTKDQKGDRPVTATGTATGTAAAVSGTANQN